MNYYGFPPGYTPDPTPTPSFAIPIGRTEAARRVNAQYISPDGEQVARRVAERPEGWVKL